MKWTDSKEKQKEIITHREKKRNKHTPIYWLKLAKKHQKKQVKALYYWWFVAQLGGGGAARIITQRISNNHTSFFFGRPIHKRCIITVE